MRDLTNKMQGRLRRTGIPFLLLAGLALAGCAETALVAHTAKQLTRDQTPATAPESYKIGNAYEVDGVWYYPKVDYDYSETGIASWYGPGFHGKSTANGESYDQNDLTAAHRTLPLPSMVRVTNLENGRSIMVRINDRGPFSNGRIIDLSRRGAELLGFKKRGTAKVLVEIEVDESRQIAAAALSGEAARLAPEAVPRVPVAVRALPDESGGRAPATEPATPAASQTALAVPGGGSDAVEREVVAPPEPDGIVTTVPVEISRIYVQAGSFTQEGNARRLHAALAKLGNVNIYTASVENRQYFRVRLGPLDTVEAADQLLATLIDNGHKDARVVVD